MGPRAISLTARFDRWNAEADFIFGYDAQPGMVVRGDLNVRLKHEHVSEFDYSPGNCRETYWMVVARENISRMSGEKALVDGFRHSTSRRGRNISVAGVRLADARVLTG